VSEACEKAGVRRCTAYALRHTYGTTCIRDGMDLPTLQARMGHADIKTTQKYLHAVEAEKGDGGFAPI
jgi:integrase/recombinase XerD